MAGIVSNMTFVVVISRVWRWKRRWWGFVEVSILEMKRLNRWPIVGVVVVRAPVPMMRIFVLLWSAVQIVIWCSIQPHDFEEVKNELVH